MTRARFPALAIIIVLSGLAAACSDGSGRYPPLTQRDFNRVQGEFAASDSGPQVLQPEPLPLNDVTQLRTALTDARARHARFAAQADKARGIVAAAAGTGPDDKRWALAMVEIAELDSRAGATTALLADLDRLYTTASLEFHEREEIASARAETAALVETEDRTVQQLADLLGPPPAP